MNSHQNLQLASVLERIGCVLEGKNASPQIDYVFDPYDDITLREVVELLKILRISAASDEYIHPNFPPSLKRHFCPNGLKLRIM